MAPALADARDRRCITTTLQATKLGAPVYHQLGYRTLTRLEMWERRMRPAAATTMSSVR